MAHESTGPRRESGGLVTSTERIRSQSMALREVPLPISREARKFDLKKPVPPALRLPPDSPADFITRDFTRPTGSGRVQDLKNGTSGVGLSILNRVTPVNIPASQPFPVFPVIKEARP